MLKLMKKVPGGTMLIPMFISALIYTLYPNLFQIPGITKSFLTYDGTNYIVALACFLSATGLKFKTLIRVLKKQGVLLLIKTVICIALSVLFFKIFGVNGIWGISAVGFVSVITSINPGLYLALVDTYGEEDDSSAFGLVSIFCVPAYPMLIYGFSEGTQIHWTPIISTLIPIALGMLIANTDDDLANFFKPALPIIMPLLGWAFGSKIHLLNGLQAGLQGIVMAIVFYIVNLPALYFSESKLLKGTGVSAIAMTTMAGMSISAPALIAESDPRILPEMLSAAMMQVTLGYVITAILTPIILKKVVAKKGIQLRAK